MNLHIKTYFLLLSLCFFVVSNIFADCPDIKVICYNGLPYGPNKWEARIGTSYVWPYAGPICTINLKEGALVDYCTRTGNPAPGIPATHVLYYIGGDPGVNSIDRAYKHLCWDGKNNKEDANVCPDKDYDPNF